MYAFLVFFDDDRRLIFFMRKCYRRQGFGVVVYDCDQKRLYDKLEIDTDIPSVAINYWLRHFDQVPDPEQIVLKQEIKIYS